MRNYIELKNAKRELKSARQQIHNARVAKRSAKKIGRTSTDSEKLTLASKQLNAAYDQIKSGRKKKRAAKLDRYNASGNGRKIINGLMSPSGQFNNIRRMFAGTNRADKLRDKAAELDAKTYKRGGKLRGRKYVYGGVLAPSYVYASAPVTAKVTAKRKAMPTLRSSAVSSSTGLAARRPASTSTRGRRRCSGGSLRTRRK